MILTCLIKGFCVYKIVSFLCLFCFSFIVFSQQEIQDSDHTLSGTQYDNNANKMYAKFRHGPDGKLFLDPYFIPFIESISNQRLLDAGCGAGPWAIHAALKGATVSCLDIQQEMINQAKEAAKKAKVEDKIDFAVSDVAFLPYPNAFFQRAISINVGCNLPSTTMMIQADGSTKKVGLGPHFLELARVLQPKGKLIVTAPASLDVIFAKNENARDIQSSIEMAITKAKNIEDSKEIVSVLNSLTDVNRATFVVRDNQLKLVTNESDLVLGENIWRKLPDLVVPNRYHSEEEYLREAKNAGFRLVKIHRGRFKNEDERQQYNNIHEPSMQLSDAYVKHYPFIVMEFERN